MHFELVFDVSQAGYRCWWFPAFGLVFVGNSDNVVTAGFNNTQSHGGPIRTGVTVRITDVGGTIARLEIAR